MRAPGSSRRRPQSIRPKSAFGLDRLTIALFATHWLDLEAWPLSVRETLRL
jgi:hypothetical protein